MAFILSSLPTATLTQLSLPLRPLSNTEQGDVQLRICDGIRRLGQCTRLIDLDLGSQVTNNRYFEALVDALHQLPGLNRLSVTDLPPNTQQILLDACPANCKIRVHRHRS
ncbi:unnamed protein product [Echinostoma caproni]|uniref:STAS domain-containing protein n=1 Tax=Echinostoma caproni TaxID=27848 RepID=A0A183ALT3_9TREM|nr:unnamed protein product [Echinostoma caproni]